MNKTTAIAITILFACHSAEAWAGYTFTQVTTMSGQPPMEVRITTDGTSSKIEYLTAQPNNPFMKPGGYMLALGDEMFFVTPSERTFARFDVGMMQGMAQEMTQMGPGGRGMFEYKNIKVEKLLDEAGESIAGHPTRHYQFKSSWTMQMTSMPMSMDFNALEDYWTTEALQVSLGKGSALLAASGLPGPARESEAAKVLKDAKGIPLRQVSVQTQKTNMNMGPLGALAGGLGAQTTKTTVEITSIQEVDVPAEAFEVPAGYREVQVFQQGPALPDLNSAGGQAAPLPDLNTPR